MANTGEHLSSRIAIHRGSIKTAVVLGKARGVDCARPQLQVVWVSGGRAFIIRKR